MKIKLSSTYQTLNGLSVTDENRKVMTLKDVITTTLCNAQCEIAPKRAWALAQEIFAFTDEIMDIPVDEVAKTKTAITNHNWLPFIKAQSEQYLEGIE